MEVSVKNKFSRGVFESLMTVSSILSQKQLKFHIKGGVFAKQRHSDYYEYY